MMHAVIMGAEPRIHSYKLCLTSSDKQFFLYYCILRYVFTQPLRNRHGTTQGQFLSIMQFYHHSFVYFRYLSIYLSIYLSHFFSPLLFSVSLFLTPVFRQIQMQLKAIHVCLMIRDSKQTVGGNRVGRSPPPPHRLWVYTQKEQVIFILDFHLSSVAPPVSCYHDD